nr:MAG TPA: hypothetical protein [Caudoviricetes sp.]
MLKVRTQKSILPLLPTPLYERDFLYFSANHGYNCVKGQNAKKYSALVANTIIRKGLFKL